MVTILSHPFFTEQVLPFLLVFVLIFAILDKTKILGEGKRQVNAIIGFVVGLMLIAFPYPRSIIVSLMPLLAVIAVILLVFMILYAFASGDKELSISPKLKVGFGVAIGLVLVIALLILTDYWNLVIGAILGGEGSEIASNIFFIVIIIAAIAIVLGTGKGGGGEEKS